MSVGPTASRRQALLGLAALLGLGAVGCSSGDDGGDASGAPSDPATSSTGRPGKSRPLPGQILDPWTLALLSDSDEIAACCAAGVAVFNVSSGKPTRTLSLPTAPHTLASGPSDLLAVDGPDGEILLIDKQNGQPRLRLTGHTPAQVTGGTPAITALMFSSSQPILASAGVDGTVRLWSTETGDQVHELTVNASRPAALAFSPDGATLAVGGEGSPVVLIDVAEANIRSEFADGPKNTAAVAFVDNTRVAMTSLEPKGGLTIWDTRTEKLVRSVKGSAGARMIAIAPDSLVAYSLPERDLVGVVDLEEREPTLLRGHQDSPYAVVLSPDGRELFSVSSREGILGWALGTEDDARHFDPPL